MKVSKSLKEVWQWKDEIHAETKEMNMHGLADYIRKGADEMCREYNLQLKTRSAKELH